MLIIATFVYAPEIRVRVAPSYGKSAGKVLDISDDLVQGVINIRTNGVHTFSFQLQNAQRKYDGVLQPMDRIVVELKRVTWVRVFSGYLNNGPIFSVWPRVLNLQASCTLKRLQFWFWDPTTTAAVELIKKNLGTPASADPASVNDNSDAGTNQSLDPIVFDKAASKTVVEILKNVVAWPPEKVHIAAVPKNWYNLAKEFGDVVLKELAEYRGLIGDFNNSLAPQATVGGTGVAVNGVLQPGSYGGTNYDADQANNASVIYNVGASRGLPPKAMVIAIATAWQESTMRNLPGGDRDSAGLFQQRPSQGWGTLQQVTTPTYAAGKFYDALVKVPGWEGMDVTVAAQKVQRSAFPSAYAKWTATATAAVDAIGRSLGGGTGAPAPGGTTPPAAGGNAGTTTPAAPTAATGAPARGTGRAVASAGFSVIKRSPPGHIRYRLGNDDRYDNPDPRVLDCSSFIDWAYYNGMGRAINPGGRSTARSLSAGSRNVSVATALATKGAVVFMGSKGSEHHVELSMGNGLTAGAHTDSVPPEKQVTVGPGGTNWSSAGLLPGTDYRDAATTPAAAAEISRVIGQPTTVSDPNEFGEGSAPGAIGAGGSGTGLSGEAAQANAENFAVNAYTWGLQPANVYGDTLAGPLAMMNDSPLLPYIAQLMAGCMRSWCSAPNGDFIAWFPDYFGIFGSAAKMNVRAIELLDFTVEWSDQEIVTHQYVMGSPQSMIDGATASVSGTGFTGAAGLSAYTMTNGIATMDYPGIMKVVFGEEVSKQFVDDYLRRFGGRPNLVNLPAVHSTSGPEFFMALYLFLQRWANQFKANVPMTFMPELWPGMLLCLPEFDFQCYVMEVQHTFQFGKGGGFQTTAKICAPARTTKKTDILGLLPLAGSAR